MEQPLDDLRLELERNLTTTFVVCRAVWPSLVEAGGGSIVTFGRHGPPSANLSSYLAAKAAVQALTEAMAIEGLPHGIRANTLAPVLIDTDQNRTDLSHADSRRWASLEEIAAAVLFLVSAAASGVNGQVLAGPGRMTPR